MNTASANVIAAPSPGHAATAATGDDSSQGAPAWGRACAAIDLLAYAPDHFGGAVVRARPGPVRDAWLERLKATLATGTPLRRMPVTIADERLLGGLDLTATLRSGQPVAARGLLAEADGGFVLIHGAERLSTALVARLSAALDKGSVTLAREGVSLTTPARIAVLAFDESLGGEAESLSPALAARLAFWIDLDAVSMRDLASVPEAQPAPVAQQPRATISEEALMALAQVADMLGITDLNALLLARRVAVALADLQELESVDIVCLTQAVECVLGPRATRLPPVPDVEDENEPPPAEDSPPEETQNEHPPPPAQPSAQEPDTTDHAEEQPPPDPTILDQALEDVLLAAAASAIPDNLLNALRQNGLNRRNGTHQGGSGQKRQSTMRGRPIGVQPGKLGGGARLALVDTLRAAAPWQRLRRPFGAASVSGQPDRVAVRAEDIRLKRFSERSESTVIFVVDASGSAAFERLAEVKGAVELILSDAYAARTQVALVVFRGVKAEVLLPPTRSLTRARSLLSGLPGGGATPLAAGLDVASALALSERRKGHTPLLLILSDARANVSRDGQYDRTLALAEAQDAARRIAAERLSAVLIDTGRWPSEQAANLAVTLQGRYAPLPRADAQAMQMLANDLIVRKAAS